ncbi:G2-specific protein kinase nimA [Penicillium argentinense]|uniref:non-specific serine/threonine protein kinase n=1 Tax=Penicillium argentinense TaxID=1131581 RepID=A0A9W9G121_9EURO|nr:G2-specific protein kinase nimA [Penicillium argentinense]KAJ5110097.1 G2-specific protein kinase nimA [Penicillium argentinense]
MAIALAEADKYEILEKIGCGSFGIIRKVKRKTDGFILCRKEINYIKMSQKEREQLTAEFNILSSLRHPNIVAYYHREHLKASQDLYLYMEYCGGGDLSMVIKNLKKVNKFAEEEFVWRILSQLITALFRCHYGHDPAEVGSNILGPQPKSTGLKGKQGSVTILHRDLKPENIFLGSDNTVKLGDFGLSKQMQSHDFASTYVGTPFYMSPEICAAEKYTLRSDIWAVGCIMYELCAKEPPFNARTHIQLVQKIREGKFNPLPDCYSPELKNVIGSCLRVNPDHRPDTAALINLPIIRLMRKEKEVVDLGKILRRREDAAVTKVREMEQALAKIEKDKQQIKAEIENTVRREWEVKARLEIDRQVQGELDRLRKRFESEVQERVSIEFQKEKQKRNSNSRDDVFRTSTTLHHSNSRPSSQASGRVSRSSVNTSEDSSTPSSSDTSQLSLESPTSNSQKQKRETRTPFCRAKTTAVVDSPQDVQMAEPSPISIASLSLSPRRTSATAGSRNIFAEAERQKAKWEPTLAYSDDEDDTPDLPSPTRPKVKPDPFKAPPRQLLRQNTACMMQKLSTQPTLFPSNGSRLPQSTAGSPTRSEDRNGMSDSRSKSPHRRLSKIPSSANLAADAGSPTRKTASKGTSSKVNANGGDEMYKAVMQRNMGGRTLVELAQARAGGRPMDEVKRCASDSRATSSKLGCSEREPPAIWDPERDEMPSPFLARGKKVIRNLR